MTAVTTSTHSLRERADRVRAAFANYVDGTGRDAHEIAAALPTILDELEHLRALELRLRELERLPGEVP